MQCCSMRSADTGVPSKENQDKNPNDRSKSKFRRNPISRFWGGGQKIYIQRGLGGWGSASYVIIIIWRDIRVGLGECNLPPPIKKSNVFHLGQNLLSLSDIILSSGFVSLDRLID